MPLQHKLTRIEKVLDYIHEHLDESIHVANLAEKSCWSRWQFQRVFGEATGLTVAQYIRELRLSKAAELLLSSLIGQGQQAITRDVSIKTAYTRQDVEITKDNSGIQGKTPIWVPEQQLNTWITYAPQQGALAGASFGAGARYVGQMQLNAANSNTVPSFTLVDLSIGYDLAMLSPQWKGASVKLAVSNALDETYYSCYDESNCWFGDQRSFEVSARYAF